MKRCPHCLKIYGSSGNFCPVCGSRLEVVHEETSGDKSSRNWVFVGVHPNACLVQGYLKSKGIHAWLEDELINTGAMWGSPVHEYAMVKVAVKDSDYFIAMKLLEEMDKGTLNQES